MNTPQPLPVERKYQVYSTGAANLRTSRLILPDGSICCILPSISDEDTAALQRALYPRPDTRALEVVGDKAEYVHCQLCDDIKTHIRCEFDGISAVNPDFRGEGSYDLVCSECNSIAAIFFKPTKS